MGRKSNLEQEFATIWLQYRRGGWLSDDIPDPEHDKGYRVDGRRWRGDFIWRAAKVALEIEGLQYRRGKKSRHQTASGYSADLEKYNALLMAGWAIYRVDGRKLRLNPLKIIQDLVQLIEKRMKDGS
jgi:hypothetical protein